MVHVCQRFGASERQACRVLSQPRTTQRRVKKVRTDEAALRTDVVRLASRFGRYGYRQITNLLRIEGWRVNHKRVERTWAPISNKTSSASRSFTRSLESWSLKRVMTLIESELSAGQSGRPD